MRVKSVGLVLSILALALLSVPVSAQPITFQLNFDEDGNGFIDNTIPDQGTLMLDPQSGLLALAYVIPVVVPPGDVRVLEPTTGALTDGLRFETGSTPGTSLMFFFSDNSDSVPNNLADTGFPTNFANTAHVFENPDGTFVYQAKPNLYFGQSDGEVPEPASMLLLGSGLLVIAGFARKRMKKA